jgi:hypothetical protein
MGKDPSSRRIEESRRTVKQSKIGDREMERKGKNEIQGKGGLRHQGYFLGQEGATSDGMGRDGHARFDMGPEAF